MTWPRKHLIVLDPDKLLAEVPYEKFRMIENAGISIDNLLDDGADGACTAHLVVDIGSNHELGPGVLFIKNDVIGHTTIIYVVCKPTHDEGARVAVAVLSCSSISSTSVVDQTLEDCNVIKDMYKTYLKKFGLFRMFTIKLDAISIYLSNRDTTVNMLTQRG